jgi:hypothetical protein
VFLNAGYKIGLNLQALPYDFRLEFTNNDLKTRFGKVITELYNNWGKKVVVSGHSFGNYQSVLGFTRMSQADKDKMVARYMALAPPYLGAVKALKMIFGMDTDFEYQVGLAKMGITGFMFKQTVALMKGFYNLFPKNTF